MAYSVYSLPDGGVFAEGPGPDFDRTQTNVIYTLLAAAITEQ